MSPRLELVWPGKDKFLLVPKDDNGKPVWVEPDHPAAREVRLTDFEAAHGEVGDDDPYWIVEGKSDVEMTSPVVLAKRDAAAAWVRTVNTSNDVSQRWGYILASESVIASANSWGALKNATGAFAS